MEARAGGFQSRAISRTSESAPARRRLRLAVHSEIVHKDPQTAQTTIKLFETVQCEMFRTLFSLDRD